MKMRYSSIVPMQKGDKFNLKQYPRNEMELKEMKAENNFEICSEQEITCSHIRNQHTHRWLDFETQILMDIMVLRITILAMCISSNEIPY